MQLFPRSRTFRHTVIAIIPHIDMMLKKTIAFWDQTTMVVTIATTTLTMTPTTTSPIMKATTTTQTENCV